MVSTPEMRLQVLSRPGVGSSGHDLIRELPTPDWSLLLSSARWHGTLPMLASCLLPSGGRAPLRSDVPDFVTKALRDYQEECLFRTLTQTAALSELQREFTRTGLKILSWKGPSTGVMLYGSATLRESVDLDFLFREEDVPQVLQVVRGLGYQLLGEMDSESRYLYVLALQGEFTFARKRDRVVLEFHLQALPPRFTRWQGARSEIQRASTVCRVAGTEVLTQNPEDLLVSLCAHATKHHWDRLKWSCDIAQFLDIYSDKIDWERLLAGLRRTRKHLTVLLGLSLAAQLFEVKLSAAVQQAIGQSPKVALLAQEIAAHILSGSLQRIDVRHREAMLDLLCPCLRDRIGYRLVPIVELNYEDLYIPVQNRKLFFVNYLFRAFRLIRKYGPFHLATKTVSSVRSVR